MRPPHGLSKHHGHVDALEKIRSLTCKQEQFIAQVSFQTYLDLLTLPHVLVLRNGVRHDDGLEVGRVDPVQGGAGENTVGQDGVDLSTMISTRIIR